MFCGVEGSVWKGVGTGVWGGQCGEDQGRGCPCVGGRLGSIAFKS